MKGAIATTLVLAGALLWSPNAANGQTSMGTAFTYQGRLLDLGAPADGDYDFEFTLYDDATAGSSVGSAVTEDDWPVSHGLFSVTLDFGSDVFTGDARWLEIGVRRGTSTGAYTYLSPRQALTPAPYAMALPGLWTRQNTTSANLIGGYNGNTVTSGVVGATIAGGGSVDPFFGINRVTDNYNAVGGGVDNQAGNGDGDPTNVFVAVVSGGSGNVASGDGTTIGGGADNEASGAWATIGGGQYHDATAQQSTVGGGWYNQATAQGATVGGGGGNIASGSQTTVGGGWLNEAAADYATIAGGGASNPADDSTRNRVFDEYGAIGGGGNNRAGSDDGNATTAPYATVAGGRHNQASRTHATVSGGQDNTASADYATVGGGISNTASTDQWTTVGGGAANTASDEGATVAGGHMNTASGTKSTVAGGYWNTASAPVATVGGGTTNTADEAHATVAGGGGNNASGWAAAVGGGESNTASGSTATIPGGYLNTAAGAYSLAAGRRAKANHTGCLVWADSTDADFASTAGNQFLIRAGGGVGIGTDSPTEQLQVADNAKVEGDLFVEGSVGIGPISPSEALTVLGNIDASGNVKAGGDVQVTESTVNSAMPVSTEQSTTSTSFVQLATIDIPDQDADRLLTLNVRFHAKGESMGQTAVFIVRGFCYGDGSTTDLADFHSSAPLLGAIHIRSSVYSDYRLNLGPFAVSDDQRWRFVVFYRTRTASYAAYIDELEWEARSIRYAY
ncbi:MAG: hypothetical protein JSV19_04800 [Phycisphaerales bacterium]|nr:MAG: hypothetical protein JSV19_04800 [Phycisphaerales bacterium]